MWAGFFPPVDGRDTRNVIGAEHRRDADHKIEDEETCSLPDSLLVLLRFVCRRIEAVTVSSRARSRSRAGKSGCLRSRRSGRRSVRFAEWRVARQACLCDSMATARAGAR
jgi:hypothetical protein